MLDKFLKTTFDVEIVFYLCGNGMYINVFNVSFIRFDLLWAPTFIDQYNLFVIQKISRK
jgi:hypothetical protein